MNYKVTVQVLNVRYEREYDSDAGPKEILERIRDAVEAEPAVPCQRPTLMERLTHPWRRSHCSK